MACNASVLSTASAEVGDTSEPELPTLVGIDGSGGSRRALAWAAARIDRFGPIQPMVVWHCPWWSYSSAVPLPAKEFEVVADTVANEAADSIPRAHCLTPIVCEGRAGRSIVEAGQSAGLIVVGTRGRSGLKDAMLGSVSSYVVAHATSPVAVIPPGAAIDSEDRRVVVGVDGSENSVRALLWAIANSVEDATIDVVHTWVYPTAELTDPAVSSRGMTHSDVYRVNAQRTLDEVMRIATESTPPEDRRQLVGSLEYGDARQVLNEYTRSHDLLVLGARGRGGIAHLLLGSVASALVHQPAIPTVVVPAAAGPMS